MFGFGDFLSLGVVEIRLSVAVEYGRFSGTIAMDLYLYFDVVKTIPIGRNLQDKSIESDAVVADGSLKLFT